MQLLFCGLVKNTDLCFRWSRHLISILKIYCSKKDIRNDDLHQIDLVANAIPGVEELICINA